MADRPVVNPQRAPVAPQVGARTRSYGGPLVQRDAQVEGLLQGLSTFNQGLTSFTGTQIDREAKMATEAGQAAAMTAPDGAPDARTFDVPFAFGEHFDAGYRSAINTKHALQAKQDFLDRFEEEHTKPGFDPQAFTQSYWSEQVAGAQDTDYIAKMSEQRAITEAHARTAFRNLTVKRATEAEHQANSAMIRDTIQPDMTPEQIVGAWREKVRPELQSRGFTRMTGAEQVALLFSHVQNLSLEQGGRPELFDAFDQFKDDKNGLTLADMNPQVSAQLAEARKAAQNLRDHNLKVATEADRFYAKQRLQDDILSGEAANYLTPDFLAEMISPTGLTDGEALSLWHAFKTQTAKVDKDAEIRAGMLRGDSALYSKEDQTRVLDAVLKDPMQALLTATGNGDVATAAAIGQQVAAAHRQFNSNAPSTMLKNFFESHALGGASKDPKALAGFEAAAETFRALPDNLQRVYTTPEGHALFSTYVALRDNRVQPDAAREQAYAAMDPKRQAEARDRARGDAAYRKEVIDAARSAVNGAAPAWMLGAGYLGFRPDNADQVQQLWLAQAEKLALANPRLTPDQLLEQGKKWMSDSFVQVRTGPTSGIAIQVPTGTADPFTAEAVKYHYENAVKVSRVAERGDGWSVAVQLTNPATGEYTTWMQGPGGMLPQVLGKTTLRQMNDRYRADKVVGADDRATMAALTQKIDAGTVTLQDLNGARGVIAKLDATGSLDRTLKAKLDRANDIVFQQASDNMLKLPDLPVTTSNLTVSPPKVETKAKVDKALTRSVAEQYLSADPMGRDHMALAKAAITLGEEVMLGRYKDPARGAGHNIGMGYNLKANAKTAEKDLRAAGVPASEVPLVISGERFITPKQAMNLLDLQVRRYEQQAKDTVEKTAPGAWARIPARAKAALIDVAWQTGNPAQFKSAVSALVGGDLEGFAKNLVVTYKDDKTGEQKVDGRRNDLRSALLAGPSRFKAVVASHGKPTKLASN